MDIETRKQQILRYMNSPLVRNAFRKYSDSIVLHNDQDKTEDVYLITQFFIPSNESRYAEIKEALQRNVENRHISHIYLLNERIYTNDELGVTSDKIEQIDIEKWLSFQDVFSFVRVKELTGYIITCNSDIFFDNTIERVHYSDLHNTKKILALLRYEYRGEKKLSDCQIFGPRWDSQDTWIFHSSYNVETKDYDKFQMYFGQPGCDNQLIHHFTVLGYDINNNPSMFRTYHIHEERGRKYGKTPLPPPYGYVIPEGVHFDTKTIHFDYASMKHHSENFTKWNYADDNIKLVDFCNKKIYDESPMLVLHAFGINTTEHMRFFNVCDGYFIGEIYGPAMERYHKFYEERGVHDEKIKFWGGVLQGPSDIIQLKPYIWTRCFDKLRPLFICANVEGLKAHPNFPELWKNKKAKFIDVQTLWEADDEGVSRSIDESKEELCKRMKSMTEGFDVLIVWISKDFDNELAFYAHQELGKHALVSRGI